MRPRLLPFVFAVLAAVSAAPVLAQGVSFEKNRVLWKDLHWTVLRSQNLDIYTTLDPDDPDAMGHLQTVADHLEARNASLSADFRHAIKGRLAIIVTGSHFEFEGIPLSGGYLPEGVGAYAMPRGSVWADGQDLIMVVKPDLLPVLDRTVLTHELTHLHEFEAVGGWKFFGNPLYRIDAWLFEAFAELFAYRYDPYTRDDARRRNQRIAAVRLGDPVFGMATLNRLKWGQADPYGMGALFLLYLQHETSWERMCQLARDIFGDYKNTRFMPAVTDMTGGKLRTPAELDRAVRNYWASVYTPVANARPKPYDSTASFQGTEVLAGWPYGMTSARPRPGGTTSYLTRKPGFGQLVVATTPSPLRDPRPYLADPNHRERIKRSRKARLSADILTDFLPPAHYEQIEGQNWNVWPFNGWDSDAWENPDWVARALKAAAEVEARRRDLAEARALYPRKERKQKDKADYKARKQAYKSALKKAEEAYGDASDALRKLRKEPGVSRVAFFARYNRDHALFVIDGNTGEFLHTIEFADLNQAFSPAFSPDGTTVYFSAARSTKRSLYAVKLASGAVPVRLNAEGIFCTAPAVSPDGTAIAYVAFVGHYQKLFLLDLTTGKSRQLTWGAYNDNSPAFSHDGKSLALTSDEHDGIWNLYTLELSSGVLRQWTEFYGGTYTCSFMPGEADRTMCTVLMEDDQYKDWVIPNLKLFALRLKEPLTERLMEPVEISMRVPSASPETVPTQPLERLDHVPQRWKLNADWFGWGSSRYGFVIAFQTGFRNVLADQDHQVLGIYTRHVRIAQYRYTNLRRPTAWSAGLFYTEYPLITQLFSDGGKIPKYPEPFGDFTNWYLSGARREEYGVDVGFKKPINRFNSFTFGARLQWQAFDPRRDVGPDLGPDYAVLYEHDLRVKKFFEESTGQHFVVKGGFQHDGLLYSSRTLGPLNGWGLNLEGEYAEPIGDGSIGFRTAKLNLRRYFALTPSVVVATRGDFFYSSRGNGDAWYMGGSETMRRYPYYSLVCNQCAYASAEVRFPLATLEFSPVFRFPIRGFAFGDVTRFRLNGEPLQDGWSAGIGLQLWALVPLQFYTARTQYDSSFTFGFNVGFPW